MQFARAFAGSFISVLTISALVAAGGAAAQTYPNRPVTLIVAFAPGGADDATARILQDPMQKALGQPIVVENVSGAGGMIAAANLPVLFRCRTARQRQRLEFQPRKRLSGPHPAQAP